MPTIAESYAALQRMKSTESIIPVTGTPASSAPAIPPPAQPNTPNAPMRTPLPAIMTLQPDQQRQWYNNATPQARLPVLSLTGNQAIGAAAQSQAIQVVKSTPVTTSSGGLSSVGLTMPSAFTVTNSPLTSNGTIAVAFATENPGTYLGGPVPGLSSLDVIQLSSAATGPGGGGPLTITGTPTSATSWALYLATDQQHGVTSPGGWTAFAGNNGGKGVWINSFTGTSPITLSQTLGNNDGALQGLLIFSGSQPSIVQQNNNQSTGSSSITCAYTSNNTVGNTLVVVLQMLRVSTGGGLSLSDSNGNSYSLVLNNSVSGTWASNQLVGICTNCNGGANTVTANFSSPVTGGQTQTVQVIEFPPLPAGSGQPFFHPLFQSDIPPISLSGSGNGGVYGILPVANGGTGANLSSTGAAHNVLKQLSTGATVTVGQLDVSDLTGTGTLLNYNNIPLSGLGLPSTVFQGNQSVSGNQTFSSGNLTALPAGLYRVSVTLIGLTTQTIPACSISYNAGPVTLTLTPATAVTTPGGFISNSMIVPITGGFATTIQTTGYTGFATYQFLVNVEQL